MIEFCTKKRMVLAVVLLIGLSVVTVILESRWSYQHKLKEARLQAIANANQTCKSNKYNILEVCKRCSRDELREEKSYCQETGYKMLIHCDGRKHLYKSCDITPYAEEKQFWIFEGTCAVLGIVSYFVVHHRRATLDKTMMDKINKQISAGI